MATDPLDGKTVVILGFARQGQALARWLPTIGANVIVSDTRDLGQLADELLDFLGMPIRFALGGHPLELLEECDALALSGSVDPKITICVSARQHNIPLTNDAQLFLERCPAPVIGITGSAGKTTTTTLVGKMCAAAGRKTWVGGNIGHVLLPDLRTMQPDHTVVMELSSFQLEIMTQSPRIACILNVTPNHLDRHGSMEAYMAAKANIFLNQNHDDLCVLGRDDPGCNVLADQVPSRLLWFSLYDMVPDGAFVAGNRLMVAGLGSPDGGAHVVCSREDIRLRGEHNVQNVLAACAVAGAAGVSIEAMREVIKTFTGVEHRLEIVRTVDGVTYVNDSIATAPERVIAALKSFTEPIVLLAGGRDKKLPWHEMATLTAQRVRYLLTFGEYGPAIAEHVGAAQMPGGRLEGIEVFKTLDEAFNRAAQVAHEGDIVLLSPG
ncbi:MAG TPA: UDP-N-acetylmuramoyl-L-alanine--D-glutamate ligase, partial [Aggregatilineales bacterium]|nr:UDP-N-acetylmuramoyl-L-alanine--D-glutamate ligase [Aggregatilineales bacterium]